MSRTPTPRDVAGQQALGRIAALAAHILQVLRAHRRGRYSSERELRSWLADEGLASTAADLAPAIGLLELTGRIERGPFSKSTSSRAGWLPTTLAYSSRSEARSAV